jgi:hypothetical protein
MVKRWFETRTGAYERFDGAFVHRIGVRGWAAVDANGGSIQRDDVDADAVDPEHIHVFPSRKKAILWLDVFAEEP